MNDLFFQFQIDVREKYKEFFKCAELIEPIANKIINAPVEGQLLYVVGRLVASVLNSHGAILLLVTRGYGVDAMRIARSIFETSVNIIWLKDNPDALQDYLDYHVIQREKLYDQLTPKDQAAVSKEDREEMMNEYNQAAPRFKKKNGDIQNQWCKQSIRHRAEHAEQYWKNRMAEEGIPHNGISLYGTFYAVASSMHHMDIAGLNAATDEEMFTNIAPTWEHLDEALVSTVEVLKCLSLYNDWANLKISLDGPNEAYAQAIKALRK